MAKTIQNKIFNRSLWALTGQLISLVIVLITNVILARMLGPLSFGRIGIIMFFISVCNILVEGGLSGALVRKLDASKNDYSTVFTFNFFVSVVCFVALVFFSESITHFYSDDDLKKPLILSGLILLINVFQIIPNTKLVAALKYKEKSLIDIISTLLSSFVGLYLAHHGYGIWALVLMQISKSFFYTVFISCIFGLFFSFRFDRKSFKQLYGFGLNTSIASMINVAFDNIYQIILGKFFSIEKVGFFYQAKRLQDVPTNLVNMLSQGVFFSALAKYQKEGGKFQSIYNSIFSIIVSFLGLITILIFCLSTEIIVLLFGVEWMGSVIFLKFLCIASYFLMLENYNRIIYKVFDRTRKLLVLEIVKKTFQILSILLGLYYKDIYMLLIGFIFSNAIGYFINYFLSRVILQSESLRELMTILKVSLLVLLLISLIEWLKVEFTVTGPLLYLFIGIASVAYLAVLFALEIVDIKNQVRPLLNK